MKLESLKKDKFEAFKENEIQNLLKVVGGRILTNWRNTDYYDSVTSGRYTGGYGTRYDRYDKVTNIQYYKSDRTEIYTNFSSINHK